MRVFTGNAFCVKQLLIALCALSMLLINVPLVNGSLPKNRPAIEIVEPIKAGAVGDPVATFEKVWLEHHVVENGVKGMRIHARFTVKNRFNIPCELIPFFSSEGGERLTRPNNEVFTSVTLTPRYDSSLYEDKVIFLPYKKFNFLQRGVYKLRLHLGVASSVWRNGKSEYLNIGTSEYVYFTYTKS